MGLFLVIVMWGICAAEGYVWSASAFAMLAGVLIGLSSGPDPYDKEE